MLSKISEQCSCIADRCYKIYRLLRKTKRWGTCLIYVKTKPISYSYVSCRMLLTRSSTATFRDFHTNSQTAITQATPIPPISTTKTPPTLAKPSSLAVLLVLVVSS